MYYPPSLVSLAHSLPQPMIRLYAVPMSTFTNEDEEGGDYDEQEE